MQKKHLIEKMNSDLGFDVMLNGRAVSRGIAIGKALCLYGNRKQYSRFSLTESEIENEINRFRSSVENAKKQLDKISSNENSLIKSQTEIFDTHKLFLEDATYLSQIEETIFEQRVNAEWSVEFVTEQFIKKYKAFSDKHLREKYIDLEDVSERLLNSLDVDNKNEVEFDENTIIIAKELNSSTLLEISKNNPKALITENGGWTSHTFILARELKIPAVTGLKNILQKVETGENIVVDGFQGKIIINPTNPTVNKYKISQTSSTKIDIVDLSHSNGNQKTLDSFEVIIRANLDSSNNYKLASDLGAKGIGLYRSEYLFEQNKDFPTEDEQVKTYKKLGELVGENGIRIRTFDLNLEQVSISGRDKEKNPALGLRGIRLAIKFEDKFREQIRAILKASFQNNVDIILPMVSDVSEILWAKSIISDEREKLELNGEKFGNPKLGSMIEVPAAILIIEKIFQESDFVCVGTNDLVQYLLAADRDNENVADWFRTLHPAVLNSIKIVLSAAEKFDKPAIICGEMAGSPLYIPILIAYGANELSMNPNSIARVRNIIKNIAQEEAKEIVINLEKCNTADDVEKLLNQHYKEKWNHLFKSNEY